MPPWTTPAGMRIEMDESGNLVFTIDKPRPPEPGPALPDDELDLFGRIGLEPPSRDDPAPRRASSWTDLGVRTASSATPRRVSTAGTTSRLSPKSARNRAGR